MYHSYWCCLPAMFCSAHSHTDCSLAVLEVLRLLLACPIVMIWQSGP